MVDSRTNGCERCAALERELEGAKGEVTRLQGELAEYWHTQFDYSNSQGSQGDYVVEATSGTIEQQGRAFDHGFEIHLEQATLLFQFAVIGGEGRYLCAPTLLAGQGKVQRPKLSDGDPMNAFLTELREVARSLRTGRKSEILDGQLARDAILLCQKQTESIRRGRPVRV